MAIKFSVLLYLWMPVTGALLAAAPVPAMKSFTIDLPRHVVRFAVPEEVAREMSPRQVESRFDPADSSYQRAGFRDIASHLHDFKGPFWSGAFGSFEFRFLIIRRQREYPGMIASTDSLDHYVRWWIGSGKGITFDRSLILGAVWIGRHQNTFGQPASSEEPNPLDAETVCYPLDEEMFLQVSFRITEWKLGSTGKWKAQAETLREIIKATVVVEAKPKELKPSR